MLKKPTILVIFENLNKRYYFLKDNFDNRKSHEAQRYYLTSQIIV